MTNRTHYTAHSDHRYPEKDQLGRTSGRSRRSNQNEARDYYDEDENDQNFRSSSQEKNDQFRSTNRYDDLNEDRPMSKSEAGSRGAVARHSNKSKQEESRITREPAATQKGGSGSRRERHSKNDE